MKVATHVADYRKLRFNNIFSDEFKHLRLLLFWPIFGIVFLFVERFYPVKAYYPVHCFADDLIPFNEYFLIPYLFWFIFLLGMHIYTLFYDVDAFEKMMKFIIITYSITVIIYLIFPTCQNLRPEYFTRNNIYTQILKWFYKFDTNTNVCPSIHVIGSLGVLFTARHTERFQTPAWKFMFFITAAFICMSTLFLKQHSVLDVVFAIPVSLIGYYFSFLKTGNKRRLCESIS